LQQEASHASSSTDLRASLAILLQHKWLIAGVSGVVLGSALFFSFRQTPVYTSETRVLVTPVAGAGQVAPLVNLDTERALVESVAVAELVVQALDLEQSAHAALDGLDVSVEPNTEILSIRYSDPDPLRAQRLSQGFAEGYLSFRRSQSLDQLRSEMGAVQERIQATEAEIADIRGEIDALDGSSDTDALFARRDSLVARLGVLQLELEDLASQIEVQSGGGEIVTPADLPGSPSSPDHVRNLALGIVIGLALGLGLALLRERLDDRLRGREDLEEQVGAPVLATVPRVEGWKKKNIELTSASNPKGVVAEAYRTLRTNLQFISRNGRVHVLSVTSPAVGEGKTTTAANIGVTMAQAGKRVIVVSCDLRKPRLHRFFGLRNSIGVTSILSGQLSLVEATQRPGIDNLRVLTSGPVPPNPAELLGSEEMDALLEELRASADFVVIDTPPVLAVADALVVAPRTDGVLIVADVQATARGAVAHVREQLEQVGSNIVGAVFNNFDPSAARYRPYRYRYSYTYRYEEGTEKQPRRPSSHRRSSSSAVADMWR
jgi:receptor protein-tyrosine kinase